MKLKKNFLVVRQSILESSNIQEKPEYKESEIFNYNTKQRTLNCKETEDDLLSKESLKKAEIEESNFSEEIETLKSKSSILSEFKDNFSIDDNESDDHSVESEYKEKSHVNDYNIPSLEHCEIFIERLNGLMNIICKPIIKEAFRFIMNKKKKRRTWSRRKSEKKVKIKKRTLKGTELQKINIRNKSFSG